VIGRQRSIGAGAIVDPDGDIITMDDVRANSELIVQIERNSRLQFVTCEIY